MMIFVFCLSVITAASDNPVNAEFLRVRTPNAVTSVTYHTNLEGIVRIINEYTDHYEVMKEVYLTDTDDFTGAPTITFTDEQGNYLAGYYPGQPVPEKTDVTISYMKDELFTKYRDVFSGINQRFRTNGKRCSVEYTVSIQTLLQTTDARTIKNRPHYIMAHCGLASQEGVFHSNQEAASAREKRIRDHRKMFSFEECIPSRLTGDNADVAYNDPYLVTCETRKTPNGKNGVQISKKILTLFKFLPGATASVQQRKRAIESHMLSHVMETQKQNYEVYDAYKLAEMKKSVSLLQEMVDPDKNANDRKILAEAQAAIARERQERATIQRMHAQAIAAERAAAEKAIAKANFRYKLIGATAVVLSGALAYHYLGKPSGPSSDTLAAK